MEREVLLTGIGGQGVQLCAQVLARAAAIEDRQVMLFGVYSGSMRGGNTDATVVVADGPLQAPPLISRTWSAVAMHDEYWQDIAGKVRDGGVVFVNDSSFETPLEDRYTVFRIPATTMAIEMGNELAQSMVMAGAFVGVTGLVSLDATLEAMRESIPPYRQQHIAFNETAIRAGYDSVERLAFPAWDVAGVGA